MRYLDISVPLRSGMAVYPDDPLPTIERITDLAAGDPCTVSVLRAGLHTGTHVDAPAHFLVGGPGVEALSLDALIGDVLVVDATAESTHLDRARLGRLAIPPRERRLLFKTAPPERIPSKWIGLYPDAADALVEAGVVLAGFDGLSCAPAEDPGPTHRALLNGGVVILEGLDLHAVPAGRYQLICLPLLVPGADGAPARAILVTD
ncbi:MAG: cyclase family protein [Dehalococcoidia bacterium]